MPDENMGDVYGDMSKRRGRILGSEKIGDLQRVTAEAPLSEMAEQLNTITYEILCDINKRIPRIYLDGDQRLDILQYIV